MIKINDTIIQADKEDMIKTLKAELYSKGGILNDICN